MNVLYFPDVGNNVIRGIDLNSKKIFLYAGKPHTYDHAGDNGLAIDASFDFVSAIALDPKSYDMYLTDAGGNRVRKITKTTGIIQTIAGSGRRGFKDETYALQAELDFPISIAISPEDGSIYVADANNYRIRQIQYKFDADLVSVSPTKFVTPSPTVDLPYISEERIFTIAGSGIGSGYGGDGGPAVDAILAFPFSVEVDDFYNVYFIGRNNVMRKVDASTGQISTVASRNGEPFRFNNPYDLAFDYNGNLLIADTDNNMVKLIDISNLSIVTVAGNVLLFLIVQRCSCKWFR